MKAQINPNLAKLTISISRLREDPQNTRKHDERNIAAILASLQEFGQQKPVVALKDGTIIAGNGTLRAAMLLGWDQLAVAFFNSKDKARAKAYAIADNRTAELAEWDTPVLHQTLTELAAAGLEPDLLHFKDDELKDLLALEEHQNSSEIEESSMPEPPENPVTQPGDLWLLGNHRLLCGDSSITADLDRLLSGSPVHLVTTDPPYNVNASSRSNNALALKGRKSSAKTTKLKAKDRAIANDCSTPEEYARLLRLWFASISRVLLPGRAFYLWGGYVNCANYPSALKENELYFSQAIIWVKEHPVMNRKDFMGNHEWCFYGWQCHYEIGSLHQIAFEVH